MNEIINPMCSICHSKEPLCQDPDGHGPAFCPTKNFPTLIEESNLIYLNNAQIGEFALKAARQEGECYTGRENRPYTLNPQKTRIQEICEFANKMNYKKIGLGFCLGLKKEAEIFSKILKAQGFDFISAICKVGGIPKEQLGVKDEEKIYINSFEPICNPVLQAKLLNEAKTDFNVILGLCVGHDSLFLKYSEALTTVLAVKDRVTGHNPLAPVYCVSSYFSKLMKPGFGADSEKKHQ